MPMAIHWDWEGHFTLEPLQSSRTETVSTSNCTPSGCSCCSNFQFLFSNTERAFEIYENLHRSKISHYMVINVGSFQSKWMAYYTDSKVIQMNTGDI